jgi:hypothetical protein
MKVPAEIFNLFLRESNGIIHGSVTLTLILRDGKPRFKVVKEISIVPETYEDKTYEDKVYIDDLDDIFEEEDDEKRASFLRKRKYRGK